MMGTSRRVLFVALIVSLVVAASATASREEAFEELLGDYEAIRVALLNDGLEGVEERARSLERKARSTAEQLGDPEAPGTEDQGEKLAAALEKVAAASGALAESKDLAAARSAMFDLTRPMVEIRHLVGDETTVVAYCSMSNKAWLQVAGDLGNPYQGQAMPACGEVVSR